MRFYLAPHRATAVRVGLGVLLVLGILLVVYQYSENNALRARLSAVEQQTETIAAALQASENISAEDKEALQEVAKRGGVIARSQDELLTEAVAKAAPAVVSLAISKNVPLLEVQYVNPFGTDPFFRDVGVRVPVFRQVGTQSQQVGAGTGFIVRTDGYVVTNRHVVSDSEASYTALLANGEKKVARVVYRDEGYDLAVLKIDGGEYATIALGDSADVKLGQTVTAIGNALGEYSNSVSVGIISGLDRTIEAINADGAMEKLSGLIQTDAAINRGNSGGPLLSLDGRAIGVNVAVDQGGNNIGFAIPIAAVKTVLGRAI